MLSPYRVLDLTDERGMLCGQMLADLGADVVAVEPPGGSLARERGPFADGVDKPESSLWWAAYSRNKRNVELDLSSEFGRERLKALATEADFLIESAEPGYMAGIGLGYDALSALNPGLIYVSISPFGQDGPKANRAATDLTLMASGGPLAAGCGDEQTSPATERVLDDVGSLAGVCVSGAVDDGTRDRARLDLAGELVVQLESPVAAGGCSAGIPGSQHLEVGEQRDEVDLHRGVGQGISVPACGLGGHDVGDDDRVADGGTLNCDRGGVVSAQFELFVRLPVSGVSMAEAGSHHVTEIVHVDQQHAVETLDERSTDRSLAGAGRSGDEDDLIHTLVSAC